MPSIARSPSRARSASRRSGEPSTSTGLVLLMCTKTRRRCRTAGQHGDASRPAPPWRHAPCAGRSSADAGRDHLVVAPQRAVEKQQVGAADTASTLRRHRGAAGHVDDAPAAGRQRHADGALRSSAPTSGAAPSSQSGTLPGTAKRLGSSPASGSQTGAELDRPGAAPTPASSTSKMRFAARTPSVAAVAKSVKRWRSRRPSRPGDMVDIAIGQKDGRDRRCRRRAARLQRRVGRDLLADVGRGIDQQPVLAVAPRRRCSTGCAARRADRPPRPVDRPGNGNSIAEPRRRPPNQERSPARRSGRARTRLSAVVFQNSGGSSANS